MSVCQVCHTKNPRDAAFCTECGERLQTPKRASVSTTRLIRGTFCPSCKTLNRRDHNFCRECGARLAPGEVARRKKTRKSVSPPKAK
jgi:uncharacterized membrane protein YvbJ